jgi:hypothetical protein
MKKKTHPIATTDCNTHSWRLSRVNRRQLVGDFLGGRLSSDAGLVLLREVDKTMQLTEKLAECIRDQRHGSYIRHSITQMLRQRIYAIAAGYEDLNDHATLREDPIMQIVAERDQGTPLASPPTLCRLENQVTRRSQVQMAEVLVETFIAGFKTPPEQLILDFDATDDPVHGNQVGRFFHGYYDHYCFLPLYVFCGDQLLAAYLRPSKIDAAKHSRAILKLLVQRLRQQWPNVKIVFRADSGFCRWRLLRWCDRHNVGYIVGLAKNSVLTTLGQEWVAEAEEAFERTQQKQRLFGEFLYGAKTWDRPRRVIVKAEHLQQGANTRFVVTNLAGDAQQLYDDTYCQRGEMENRIKEQQLYLFADRTSCHAFEANQFRLLLSSAAYVLIEHLRRVYLDGTEWRRARVDTIRIKLFKVAARVTHSVRRVVLHLCSSYPYQQQLLGIVSRLQPSLNPSLEFP